MKKKIYIDNLKRDEIKRELNRSLNYCRLITDVLLENGFNISESVVKDCIMMQKSQRKGALVDKTEYIGADSAQGEAYEVDMIYNNCQRLDEEFERIKTKSINKKLPSVLQYREVANMEYMYAEMKAKIYEMLHPISNEIDYKYLIQWLSVEGDVITLCKDVEEMITKESTVYCESKQAEQAFQLHKEAAQAVQAFISLFGVDKQPDDIGDLFTIWNGEVKVSEINYNKYL